MARFISRFKRISRRRRYKRVNLKRRKMIKSLSRAARLVKRYSLPTTQKLIGMSEKKHLILRTILDSKNAMKGSSDKDTNQYDFQILLDPMQSPDISKVFRTTSIIALDKDNKQQSVTFNLFKYDYMRIKNVLIVIRPITSTPNMTNALEYGNKNSINAYVTTPIYGYYTLKFPKCLSLSNEDEIKSSYSIYPPSKFINQEGCDKTLFTIPANKPITLVLNSLKMRSSSVGPIILGKKLIDLQNITSTNHSTDQNYNPYNLSYAWENITYTNNLNKNLKENLNDNLNEKEINNEIEEYEKEDYNCNSDEINNFGVNAGDVDFAATDETESILNLGRVVLRAQFPYQFTVEILYDCDFYR